MLAMHGGVVKHTQIKYESGINFPNAEYLARVAAFGVDVLYVVTGQRAVASAHADAMDELASGLRERGIEMAGGARQNEAEISPLGLMWLLNFQQQSSDRAPLFWDQSTLRNLAAFKSKAVRGLNIQLVPLLPYGDKPCKAMLFYLDKTPPDTLWWMPASAGVKERYELDVDAHTLPLFFPDSYPLVPILQISPEDLARLKAGETLHIKEKI